MIRRSAIAVLTVMLSACGGGQLTTSGADKDQQVRAFLTGFSVAGATRCNLGANPSAIRAGLLEFEQGKGKTGTVLFSSGQIFDHTLDSGAQSMQSNKDYCTPEKIALLKADLARFAAKDFALKPDAPSKGG